MRAKALLLSLVVVVSFIGWSGQTQAVGTATLTGSSVLLPNPGYWWPDEPVQLLSGIAYRSTTGEQNDVTIEKIPGVSECIEDPFFGSCAYDGLTHRSERYSVVDLRGTLAGASGLCHRNNPRSGYCETPLQWRNCGSLFCTDWYTLPQSPLPITVELGPNNDQFRAATPPGGTALAFTIVGGDGDDSIRLVDLTPSGDDMPAYDAIACGPGNDAVVTTLDVAVGADCESVSRI